MVGAYPGLDSALGFEEATRGALKVLIDGLNDEIEARSERWSQADLEWQAFVGGGIGQTDVPLVLPEHFHEGPHMSVMKAPPEDFPMVAVMSYFTQPVSPRMDQVTSSNLRLAVEAYCITGPVADAAMSQHEAIVHRKVERTTEAINACLMRQRDLCGAVQPGITEGPRGGPGTQSFMRKEESGAGPQFIWQGSRLEYTLQRDSMF